MLKRMFLIDGAAGTGKTDLIQYVKNRYFDANVVCKYTTRAIRDEDDKKNLDLIIEALKSNKTVYTMRKNQELYGEYKDRCIYCNNISQLLLNLEKER